MLALSDGDIAAAARSLIHTPYRRERLRSSKLIERQFDALLRVQNKTLGLEFAYSVKTNPASDYLAAVRTHGLYAECISVEELDAALAHRCATTIFNGPFPAWRSPRAPDIALADSYEALARNAARFTGTLCGIRIRPPGITSRFGIAGDDAALVQKLRHTGRTKTAVSFHVRPEDYAGRSWRDIVGAALACAQIIDSSGIDVTAFDVGGGWTPESFDDAYERGDFAWLIESARATLPHCTTILAEPGQAIVSPCEFFVAPILEVRNGSVVIDAGYPDIPQMHAASHRLLLARADGHIELLTAGSSRILGATCLEYDAFDDRVALPGDIDDRAAIVVADCGAYDSSMSFSFAKAGEKSVA